MLLTAFFYDQKIAWWESASLIAMYFLYAAFMSININHDYNFTKTRERKLLGAILCMDHFN
jgi:Ca2+/Na+ antiporter